MMADKTTPGGVLHDPVNGGRMDEPSAVNMDARLREVGAKTSAVADALKLKADITALNAVRATAQTAQSTSLNAQATVYTATFAAGSAQAAAGKAVDRVTALESAAGFGPSTPTDGTIASYMAQPGTQTREAVRVDDQERAQARPMYRGLCVRTWQTGYLNGGEARTETKRILDSTGGDSITLVVNCYQPTMTSVGPFTQPTPLSEVEGYVRWAHAEGYRIILKPHVEPALPGAPWRANFAPTDPAQWFNSYSDLMAQYAALAQRLHVEVLCVGSEYNSLTAAHPDQWRRIIAECRSLYDGLMTYGASFNAANGDEGSVIEFWDDLDFIGLDYYTRLPHDPAREPYTDDQIAAWIEMDAQNSFVMTSIEAVAHRFGKPVLLAEYGVPMKPEGGHIKGYSMSFYAQYLRLMWETFTAKPWFMGGFIWSVDPIGMFRTEYAADSPVMPVLAKAHSARPLTARPDSQVTDATTYRAGSAARFVRVATLKVPRTWSSVTARIRMVSDVANASYPEVAIVEARVGRADGSAAYADVRQVGHSNMPSERVGYTLSGDTLTLWAQARAGQAFHTHLEYASIPAWVELLHLATPMLESTPSGFSQAGTRQAVTTTTSKPEYHYGDRTLSWGTSGTIPWWVLNGHLTIRFEPGVPGLMVSRVFKFEQDATGYRNLTLVGANQPRGTVRLARRPGQVTWVEFHWDGTAWSAWALTHRNTPEALAFNASIAYGGGTSIRGTRDGSTVQVTYDVENTTMLEAGKEVTLFYVTGHEPLEPVRGVFSTISAPAAGTVRSDGTQIKVTPSTRIEVGQRLQGTLTWITTA